jgi:hypothetical protein
MSEGWKHNCGFQKCVYCKSLIAKEEVSKHVCYIKRPTAAVLPKDDQKYLFTCGLLTDSFASNCFIR